MEKINAASKDLASLNEQLAKLYAIPFDQLTAEADAVEIAKLEATLAYTCASLYTLFLMLEGDDLEHPMFAQLERIKGYIAKIKQQRPASVATASDNFIRETIKYFN